MENPYKCGFLKLSKCYNLVTTRYDANDPATWDKLVNTGFVLKVREITK